MHIVNEVTLKILFVFCFMYDYQTLSNLPKIFSTMSSNSTRVVYSRASLLNLKYAPASKKKPTFNCDETILQIILKKNSSSWRKDLPEPVKTSPIPLVRSKPIQTDDKQLEKQVRLILNKLTPENLKTLTTEFKKLNVENINQMKIMSSLIYKKALEDPTYAETYTFLCLQLVDLKVQVSEGKWEGFPNQLSRECKNELLVKYQELDIPTRQLTLASGYSETVLEDLEYTRNKQKTRKIRNANFIGYLYRSRIIKAANVNYAIGVLLKEANDVSIEILCSLLFICGKSMSEELDFQIKMARHFQVLEQIKDSGTISKRIKFRIEDLLKFKKEGYQSKSHANPLNSKVPI